MNSTRSPPGTGRGPLSTHAIRPASPQQQHQTEATDQGSSRMRKFQQVKPSNMQGERRIITTWGLSQDRKVGLTSKIIVIHYFNRLKQRKATRPCRWRGKSVRQAGVDEGRPGPAEGVCGARHQRHTSGCKPDAAALRLEPGESTRPPHSVSALSWKREARVRGRRRTRWRRALKPSRSRWHGGLGGKSWDIHGKATRTDA